MGGSKPVIIVIFVFFILLPLVGADNQDATDLEEMLKIKINTAMKYSQTTSEAPSSVTIVTAEDIEQFGYRTLDELLMRVRGFYLSDDRNNVYLGVRGISRLTDYNNKVLILINGVSIADNIAGSALIGTELGLDVDAIERVVIVRGPCSALYGTNAMLAVIDIITKKGNALDGLRLTLQPGSFGKIQGGLRYGKKLDNDLEIFFSGHIGDIKGQDFYYQEFDAPFTNNGTAVGLDWDNYYGIFTGIKYKNFSLQAKLNRREKGIPTAPYHTAFNDDRIKTIDKQHLIELKYEKNISYDKTITLRGYFNNFSYWGVYPYNLPGYEVLEQNKAVGNRFGLETQFKWDIRADNELIVGAEYKKNTRAYFKYWNDYATFFDQNFPFDEYAVYIQDEHQLLENLFLMAGLRFDHYSDRGNSLTPRAALIFNPGRWTTLKLLYGNAYRAPNIYEMYYGSATDPAAGVSQSLEFEKINTVELVLEQRLGKNMQAILSAYGFKMKGLIDLYIDPFTGRQWFQNLQDIEAMGIEAELNIRLKNGLIGYASYNFQEARDTRSDGKISNSPAHLFKAGLSLPVFKHFFASLETVYESSRITLWGTRTDGFLLTNVNLCSKKFLNHFKFSIRIWNLFDIEYRYPGRYDHIQRSLPQDGRSLTLRLEYMF
jgi:iron complex outermembrane receptor protein